MAGWDGSGTFTRAYNWVTEAAAGNVISSLKFDTENDAFTAGINNCLAKDGQNAATGDIPMGGKIHTGVGDGTALTHYPSIKQVQGGSFNSGVTGGSANAQTLALSPAASIYAGQLLHFTAGFTNTGAATLDVNGLGAKDININGSDLVGGEIIANRSYTVKVNSVLSPTVFDLIGPMPARDVAMACKAVRTSSQTISASTNDEIDFTASDDYDPFSLHNPSTNPERILTAKVGLWLVTGFLTLSSTVTGYVSLKNSSVTYAKTEINGKKNISISGAVYASATSHYAMMNLQNTSAGDATVTAATLAAVFVG